MKKLIMFVLSIAMLFSLCACGGGNDAPKTDNSTPTAETAMTKEEMLEQAEEVNASLLNNDCFDNLAKAKQTYCDKVIITKAYVYMVNEDHVVLGCSTSSGAQVCIAAYMPVDDLVQIESSSVITVVGLVSDIEDRDFDWGGMTVNYPHYIMDTAYLVTE